MAKDINYVITHSNYTLQEKHKLTEKGVIYERDYMTNTGLGGWGSETFPYGTSNFKLTTRANTNTKRKHDYGQWLKHDIETGSENDGSYWNLTTLANNPSTGGKVTTEGEIVLNPNYKSLLDFCYFGNCTAMIQSSIDKIILNYPGELYVTDSKFAQIEDKYIEFDLGDDLVAIENPFDINVLNTLYINNADDSTHKNINVNRYLSNSQNEYEIIDPDITFEEQKSGDTKYVYWSKNEDIVPEYCINQTTLIGEVYLTEKKESGLTIYVYNHNINGKNYQVLMCDSKYTGFRVRQVESKIDEFFDTLDDFEKFLLNRDTEPLYTIKLEDYTEDEYGTHITLKKFTWPTTHDWNLDFISFYFYDDYLSPLLRLSNYLDDNYCNNMWRMMTHDAIKNMDRTFASPKTNEDYEDYNLGITNLQGFFYACGRFFDDFKRDIDNIGYTNKITYDNCNNIPDYFLTDKLQLQGWEITSPTYHLDSSVETEILYPSENKNYNVTHANISFFKNLSLNSKEIFSRKGTKQSLEMVLGLFGLRSYDFQKKIFANSHYAQANNADNNLDGLQLLYDYKIDEYVYTIKNTAEDICDVDSELPMEKYSKYRDSYSEYGDSSPIQGLPVRYVYFVNSDGEELKYIIPWFDKLQDIDGSPYFQMFGGWGKVYSKNISNTDAPDVKTIISNDKLSFYDETIKYIKIVKNLDSLTSIDYSTIQDGEIVYVYDISGIENYFTAEEVASASHYFYIENRENSYFINTSNETAENESSYEETTTTTVAESTNEETTTTTIETTTTTEETTTSTSDEDEEIGWVVISNADIEKGINLGVNVLYLESIIDDYIGNNPHIGYGNYDDGDEFIDYFRHIFKYSLENDGFSYDAYDCETGEIYDDIKNCGFDVSDLIVDNVKCWYFKDTTKTDISELEKNMVPEVDPISGIETEIPRGYTEKEETEEYYVGISADTFFRSELVPFNLETQEENNPDEASSFSVINGKKMVITFTGSIVTASEFKDFFTDTIMPYLRQVIPSTTILEIKFENENVEFTDASIPSETQAS